jgi:hypothetical protein
MGAAFHTNHEQRRHLWIDSGLLVNLLLKRSFLLSQQLKTVISDLGQTNPFYGFTADNKGVAGLFTFAGDAGLMLLNER